jgi:flagellar basal-body rod protein FlgB
MNIARDTTLYVLEKGLDALSARQTAVSNNIANVETPNYKAVDVRFESILQKTLSTGQSLELVRTNPMHLTSNGTTGNPLDALEPVAFKRSETSMRKDGNNVDVEREMIVLADTSLRYQAVAMLANKKLAMMRMIAQESR